MKKLSVDEMKKVSGLGVYVNYLGCENGVCCKGINVAFLEIKQCGNLEWYLSSV